MTESREFHCDKIVRFQHCDPAGIVFFPQYFVLFHEVIEDWFNDGLGVDYAGFIGNEKLGIPTASIQAEFVSPGKHGETLRFGLRVREIGRSSIKLRLTACVGTELRARIDQTVVLFSLEQRYAVAVPIELKERMLMFSGNECPSRGCSPLRGRALHAHLLNARGSTGRRVVRNKPSTEG
jgi:4-hydroxybenzoyl-CoA thioesterase